MEIVKKINNSKKEFRNEFKKTLGGAIVAALGLIIALSWKDVLNEYLDKLVSLSPIQGKLISASIITIFSVAIILIVTKFIKSE